MSKAIVHKAIALVLGQSAMAYFEDDVKCLAYDTIHTDEASALFIIYGLTLWMVQPIGGRFFVSYIPDKLEPSGAIRITEEDFDKFIPTGQDYGKITQAFKFIQNHTGKER